MNVIPMKANFGNRMALAVLLTILLTFTSPVATCAQGDESLAATTILPADPRADLSFKHLTSEDGLSSNRVTSVIRDSKGFMWFGTFDGLNRYDGYEFKVYRHDPDDENSLSANFVVSLLQDEDGFLWVGTNGGGLNRYDPRTEEFIHYRYDPADPHTVSSDSIIALYQDREGILWIGTDGGGLNRYDPGGDDGQSARFARYLNDPDDPHSLSHNVVWSILEGGRGTLWVGTDGGGLNRFDRQMEKFAAYRHDPENPHSLGDDSVLAIAEGLDGSLWLGTRSSGLDRFDPRGKTFAHFRHDPDDPHSLSHNSILELLIDQTGGLWIGTGGGGLNQFDVQTERFSRYQPDPNDPYSLNHNQIKTMYADLSGLLWLATVGGGVNMVDLERKPFAHYHHKPGDPNSLSSNDVSEIYEDRGGTLWLGTGGGGLNRLDRQTMQYTHYVHDPNDPHSLSDNLVRAIVEDGHGVLWLATRGGLNRFDPQKEQFTAYHPDLTKGTDSPSGLLSDSVWSMHLDSEGMLWIGTSLGLNQFDPRSSQFLAYQHDPDDPDSLSGNTVTVIHEDRVGTLWFGMLGDGLNRFDPESERFVQYRHDPADPQSLGGNTVWAIHEDSEGVLWIGTSAGLDRLDPDEVQFTHYGEGVGLPGGGVMSVLEDDGGPLDQGGPNLWLSTSSGLYKFDPRTETLRRYGVGDGLQGNEFAWGSAFKSASGELFFGGSNGLTAFYPDQILDSPHLSPIVLTDLQLANKPVEVGSDGILLQSIAETEHLALSHEDRVISLEFAALGYRAPEKSRYRYLLEGFDEDWTEVGSDRRFVTYTNLDPGEYVFRVTGSNSDGVWSEQGTSLKITITPPWWQTTWAYGLLLILAVAGLYGAYRWRVRSLAARSRELETLVAEKTRQLDERVKELNTILTLSQDVVSTLELEPLLSLILDQLKGVMDYDMATIRRLDRGVLELQACRRFFPHSVAPTQDLVVADIPILHEVVKTREASLFGDIRQDPSFFDSLQAAVDYRPGLILQEARTLMLVPLVFKDQVIGMLVLGHRQPDSFDRKTMALAQAFANQAAVAIANAELYERAGEEATLEERTRLARELHDSATQSLYSATLFSEAGKELAAVGDLESTQHYLSRVGEVVHQALKDMRLLVYELRPPVLKKEGLVGALQRRLDSVEKRAGMEARLISDELPPLPDQMVDGLYRIAQEALNNVLKHAEADAVTVTIRADGDTVTLEVVDDGQGFDPEAARDSGGMGLVSMRERAAKLGSDLFIDSVMNQGTKVQVAVELA